MNGKQLKNSILQWAIQGKLIPQDPNDEPASVLLERIREEKARLVKEGKIKKDKNESIIFRGDDNSYYEKFHVTGEVKCIDEEIPFEIPKGWEWIRLSSIVSILGDGIHGTPEYDDTGNIFFINGNNLNNGKIIIKADTKRLNRTEANKHRRALDKNTILVSINGTIGNIAFYNNENIILGKSACYFNILGNIDKDYIKLIIESDYFISYAKSVATGSTIKNVPLSGMRNFFVPLPPIKEQTRIVSKISDLSVCINNYSRLQKEVNHLNHNIFTKFEKSILQEAIQGRLVPQDPNDEPASVLLERIREEKQRLLKEGKLKKKDIADSIIFKGEGNKYFEKIGNDILCLEDEMLFDLPDKWVWTRLSTIANLYTGNSISETDKKQKYTDVHGLEYIGTKDVGFDHLINYSNGVAIPLQHIENFKIAPSHSVLLCIEGGSAGRKIARLQKDVCFGNKLCCLSPYFVSLSEYIYYYLQSPAFFESFQGNIAGIIGGVSVNTLKSLLIPLPPIEEIKRITIRLQEVLSSIMSR